MSTYEMIDQRNTEQLTNAREPLRNLHVLHRRLGLSARMVMGDDDRPSSHAHGRTINLARVDHRPRKATDADLREAYRAVSSVKKD